jgi:hypothetical protein
VTCSTTAELQQPRITCTAPRHYGRAIESSISTSGQRPDCGGISAI